MTPLWRKPATVVGWNLAVLTVGAQAVSPAPSTGGGDPAATSSDWRAFMREYARTQWSATNEGSNPVSVPTIQKPIDPIKTPSNPYDPASFQAGDIVMMAPVVVTDSGQIAKMESLDARLDNRICESDGAKATRMIVEDVVTWPTVGFSIGHFRFVFKRVGLAVFLGVGF